MRNALALFASTLLCLLNLNLTGGEISAVDELAKSEHQVVKKDHQDNSPDQRSRVVIVRPIILCDDNGSNPAEFNLPKKLVDQVYTKADLEFIYLPPTKWNFGKGRQGKVNLDTIVKRGRDNGMISLDPRVVTLLFVSNVDGNAGPLGRGLQNGNICFVCLGPDEKNNEPGLEEFVIAHEVGHCLNLIHTVDDPNVPDDLVNLQGDGPYKERLAVEGLHDTQRDTVLKSLLVNDRIHFHTLEESQTRLIDETWEPYLSGTTTDMVKFCLGLDASASVPTQPERRLEFARQGFQEFAAEFTEEEQTMLKEQIKELEKLTGNTWPLLTRFPWNFIKAKPGFCSDFPHTRGLSIVLSERVLQRMKADPVFAITILLHEKIHVLQRACGKSFEELYHGYGYKQFDLAVDAKSKLNLAQNPDALSSFWFIQVDGMPHMLATEIEAQANRLTFAEKLFPLIENADGTFSIAQAVGNDEIEKFKQNFSIPTGFDHPNEVAAHTSQYLLFTDFLDKEVEVSDVQKKYADLTREEFKKIFAMIGE